MQNHDSFCLFLIVVLLRLDQLGLLSSLILLEFTFDFLNRTISHLYWSIYKSRHSKCR